MAIALCAIAAHVDPTISAIKQPAHSAMVNADKAKLAIPPRFWFNPSTILDTSQICDHRPFNTTLPSPSNSDCEE